jgi:hypothetical protein
VGFWCEDGESRKTRVSASGRYSSIAHYWGEIMCQQMPKKLLMPAPCAATLIRLRSTRGATFTIAPITMCASPVIPRDRGVAHTDADDAVYAVGPLYGIRI